MKAKNTILTIFILSIFLLFSNITTAQETNIYFSGNNGHIFQTDENLTSILNTSTADGRTKNVVISHDYQYLYSTRDRTAGNSYIAKIDPYTLNLIDSSPALTTNGFSTNSLDIDNTSTFLYTSCNGSTTLGNSICKIRTSDMSLNLTSGTVGFTIDNVLYKDGLIFITSSGALNSKIYAYYEENLTLSHESATLNKPLTTNSDIQYLGKDNTYIYAIAVRSSNVYAYKINPSTLAVVNVSANLVDSMSLNAVINYEKTSLFISNYLKIKEINLTDMTTTQNIAFTGTPIVLNAKSNSLYMTYASTNLARILEINNTFNDTTININLGTTLDEALLVFYNIEPSGNNSNLTDTGLYDTTFFGGLFNLQAGTETTIDLDDYFSDIDEWYILSYDGEELYDVGDKFVYPVYETRTINGQTYTTEKDGFSIEKGAGNTIIFTAGTKTLTGVGLYGSLFGFPLYNNESVRIGEITKNMIVQVFDGLTRTSIPTQIISQDNRDAGITDYEIELFEYYDGVDIKNDYFIQNISIFINNTHQGFYESFIKGYTLNGGLGVDLTDFNCTTFGGIVDVICTYDDLYFTIRLNRYSGVLTFIDKGTLSLYDSVSQTFKIITYQPSFYVNDLLVSDDYLDNYFVLTTSDEALSLDPTLDDPFSWFNGLNLFPDAEDLTTKEKFMRILFVMLGTIIMGIIFGYDQPQTKGYLIPIFTGLLVFEFIFFVFIGYIATWILLLTGLIALILGFGYARQIMVGGQN